ncbi:MAG: hypothetical protein DWQ34_06795 [Planctomycetota bacterium]|nr:MAG: hypothetical protein DWQ34_06795 [Planctomycetota bacterium]REK25075.1 MAG: hypothetical protein DWQ41_12945 [Planctomycetota bacterium]REK28140.1 MAG: hypothetical protein DWQ45_25270 [Planctomycetota bacterium]
MKDTTSASETANAFSQSTGLDTRAGETGDGLYVVFARRDQPADWSEGSLDGIERLGKLNHNWDSYGANPVVAESIEVAKLLVRMFAQVTGIDCPRIAASPAGNVALSWEWREHSRELDLEILPDGSLRYSYLDERQPSQDCEGETTDPNLIAHLLTKW